MNELVVARYNEDISWLGCIQTNASYNVSIYNKGEPIKGILRGYKELPNVGREAHTYLYHIVHNWDNLAYWTVFTQAKPEDHTTGDKFADLMYPRSGGLQGVNRCYLAPDLKEGNLDWSRWPLYKKQMESGEIQRSPVSFECFFNMHVGGDIDPEHDFYFAGAIFGVASYRIKCRPRLYYEHLLKEVDHHVHPEEAHYMERLWYSMFSGEVVVVKS